MHGSNVDMVKTEHAFPNGAGVCGKGLVRVCVCVYAYMRI